MDWKGDNVAGLIVMKVREELFQEAAGCTPEDNTLTQITCDEDTQEHMDTDHDRCPLESTLIQSEQQFHTGSSPSESNSAKTNARSSSHGLLYTDVIKSHGVSNAEYSIPHYHQGLNTPVGMVVIEVGVVAQPTLIQVLLLVATPRTNSRARGRLPYSRGSFPSTRHSQDMMSSNDQDFLYGSSNSRYPTTTPCDNDGYVTPRKTVKSPKSNRNSSIQSNGKSTDNAGSVMNLTEHQRQGLIDLIPCS